MLEVKRNFLKRNISSFFLLLNLDAARDQRSLPTNPICTAIDAVDRFMKRKGYALCGGRVYKKAPDSLFTYVYCTDVENFLLRSLANSDICNVLTPYVNKVTALLEKPACRAIKPIKVVHDVVEVLPAGTLFVISKKRFIHLKEFPTDCTPRAFIRYEYKEDCIPYPLPFVQGNYKKIFSSL